MFPRWTRKPVTGAAKPARVARAIHNRLTEESVPAKSKPPQVEPFLRLRAAPQEKLSESEVKAMLQRRDFFCVEGWDWSNSNGKGILHKYEVQQNGQVVYDATTGLYWQQSGSPDYMNFESAQKYIEKLQRDKFAGYSDWRLPTLEEAMSLMEREQSSNGVYIDAKFDKTQDWIWTADKYGASRVWVVVFGFGRCDDGGHVNDGGYVRAVR